MDENPYKAPDQRTNLQSASAGSRHTRWFFLAFYTIAVVRGITNVLEPSGLEVPIAIALNICLAGWALVDASRRRQPIPPDARCLFIVLAGLVVPGYVIWSRGWRGIVWVVIHVVGWCLLMLVTMDMVGFAKFGDEW